MSQSVPIIATLKKILRSRGITYADLAVELGISETSVKRTFAEQSFSLDRLLKVCEIAGISFGELGRLAEHQDGLVTSLSIDQEERLAMDDLLFVVFYLVSKKWTLSEIVKKYKIQLPQCRQYCQSLEQMGLIERHPKDRIKLKVSARISWAKAGPIETKYKTSVLADYLNDSFSGKDQTFQFIPAELSKTSIQIINTKLKALAVEVESLAKIDAIIPKEQAESFGTLIATRRWIASPFAKYQR